MLRSLKQRGDTIVEVMVVLAVLGLAIGISYATANRSLLSTRGAQENSQATEYAQAQVEALRALAGSSGITNTDLNSNIFLPTVPYCVPDPTASEPLVTTVTSCNFGSAPYTLLIYNCNKIHAQPCDPSPPRDTDTFIVVATWIDVEGRETDSATMAYRVHAP